MFNNFKFIQLYYSVMGCPLAGDGNKKNPNIAVPSDSSDFAGMPGCVNIYRV